VLRRLFTVRGLVGLLLTLAAAAGMLRLGKWQLGRGETTHSLQNYSYAVEWVLFAGFALFCFYKLVLAEEHEQAEPKVDVVLPPPRPAVEEPEDDELAAYNAYLRQLNAEQSP
jgi:DNA-binding transcriptional regulator of glucitol operon